jgi:hypothetical protein
VSSHRTKTAPNERVAPPIQPATVVALSESIRIAIIGLFHTLPSVLTARDNRQLRQDLGVPMTRTDSAAKP